jgi:hypothetical protein
VGDDRNRSAARPRRRAPAAASGPAGGLRGEVIREAPAVFVTLLSVLVGLVLTDLVTEARARMHLWPLDAMALRTWAELISTGTAAISVWVVLANVGLGRRRLPHVAETTSAFAPPLLLLTAATFVGRPEAWPWLYGAGTFLAVSGVAGVVNVRLTMDQPDGARFAHLLRPQGFLLLIWLGVPLFLGAGWFDQHGWLPPTLELAIIALPIPLHFVITGWFYNDWSAALGDG